MSLKKMPVMTAGWLANETYVDGGCHALFLGKNLFAEMAQKGKHKLTGERCDWLAAAWNRTRIWEAA